jgi:hypothetical protein
MPDTSPLRWWCDDRAFYEESAAWPCRVRLAAAAARLGLSLRMLALELVAVALARFDWPRPRHWPEQARRPARGRRGIGTNAHAGPLRR